MGDYRVAPRTRLARGLAAIRCPVTVVWGASDAWLPPEIADDLARRIPDARLEVFEDAGHFVVEERPAEVWKALSDLLLREESHACREAT
jgi:pimeloyl-ACP methyl ester carboxylesterase